MQNQPRVLAIHDISCIGRCSLTVALPIISSVGLECSVIPTAVLSTHTGGFTGYTYNDMTSDIPSIFDHWKTLDISFDAIYTGFLGSEEQIDILMRSISEIRRGGTVVIVDPAMADNGSMYACFDMDFAKRMGDLCSVADIIIPNITEACFILGRDYVPGPYTRGFIDDLLKGLTRISEKVVLTGVSFGDGRLGAAFIDSTTGESGCILRDAVPGYYHGTGDVFASAFTSAYVKGKALETSVAIAVDFTVGSILRTYEAGTDVRYGVNFEEGLHELNHRVRSRAELVTVRDGEIHALAEMASGIWHECFTEILSKEQIDYMVEMFQSEDAMRKQITEDGYRYYRILADGETAGYTAIRPQGDRLFVSKVYLKKEFRHLGIGSAAIMEIDGICRREGFASAYLTVNKANEKAIKSYRRNGYECLGPQVTDIGNGFVMDDYVMEKVF